MPNDRRLATECGDIVDLILAGHDHHYNVTQVGPHSTWVCKSGSDFRDCTKLVLDFGAEDGQPPRVESVERVTLSSDMEEDPESREVVAEYLRMVSDKMDQVIGETAVPLESRFFKVRTEETNMGNFIADLMRGGSGADIAILNSGTIRADTLFPPGQIKMRDVLDLLPMVDELCVLRLTGKQVLAALENGVCKYPRLEGRFPCVSGLRFAFDAAKPEGERVVPGSVVIDGKGKLNGEDLYTLVTKEYLGTTGKDGYSVFLEAEQLPTSLPHLSALLRSHFADREVQCGERPQRRRGEPTSKTSGSPQRGSGLGKETVDTFHTAIGPGVDGRIECVNKVDVIAGG